MLAPLSLLPALSRRSLLRSLLLDLLRLRLLLLLRCRCCCLSCLLPVRSGLRLRPLLLLRPAGLTLYL